MQDINGKVRLDFQHDATLRTLTACLLHRDFGLRVHLPVGKLVPTLPLRLNYILWLEDVLRVVSSASDSAFPAPVTGIDIGCGASCVYPLLGARRNNWRMFGLESNADSVQHARANVAANHMSTRIEIVAQAEQTPDAPVRIFDALLRALQQDNDPTMPGHQQRIADFCMCNPPFFSAAAASSGPSNRSGHRPAPRVRLCTGAATSAAATSDELAVHGGETAFVAQIIAESRELGTRIRVYSTMLGHKASVAKVMRLLSECGVQNVCRTEFCQGRTTRWGVAWSFDDSVRLSEVPATGPTWGKPATHGAAKRKSFAYAIPDGATALRLLDHQQRLEAIVMDIGLQLTEKRHVSGDLWMARIVATSNTWTNQRRRRREMQRAAAAAAAATGDMQTDAATADQGVADDADECFYDDEGWQQAHGPAGKRLRLADGDGSENSMDSGVSDEDPVLSVQLSILRDGKKRTDGASGGFTLDMEYASGSAALDGAYQLMQFIQNRWK